MCCGRKLDGTFMCCGRELEVTYMCCDREVEVPSCPVVGRWGYLNRFW